MCKCWPAAASGALAPAGCTAGLTYMYDPTNILDINFWTFTGDAASILANKMTSTAKVDPVRTRPIARSADVVALTLQAKFKNTFYQNGELGTFGGGPGIPFMSIGSNTIKAVLQQSRSGPDISKLDLYIYQINTLKKVQNIANYGSGDPVNNQVATGTVKFVVTLGSPDSIGVYLDGALIYTFDYDFGSIGSGYLQVSPLWDSDLVAGTGYNQTIDVGEIYAISSAGLPYACDG